MSNIKLVINMKMAQQLLKEELTSVSDNIILINTNLSATI